jgi:hypothetical protein
VIRSKKVSGSNEDCLGLSNARRAQEKEAGPGTVGKREPQFASLEGRRDSSKGVVLPTDVMGEDSVKLSQDFDAFG